MTVIDEDGNRENVEEEIIEKTGADDLKAMSSWS